MVLVGTAEDRQTEMIRLWLQKSSALWFFPKAKAFISTWPACPILTYSFKERIASETPSAGRSCTIAAGSQAAGRPKCPDLIINRAMEMIQRNDAEPICLTW
jgi:hypothetical protein